MNRNYKDDACKRAIREFVDAVDHGCDGSRYRQYQETGNLSHLVGCFVYNALSRMLQNLPAEGPIIIQTSREAFYATPGKLQQVLGDVRGMFPKGVYERIQVVTR